MHQVGPQGIILKNTRVSIAFSLITFLVGDLIFVSGFINPSKTTSPDEKMESEEFHLLKKRIFDGLGEKKEILLDLDTSILFYRLIDVVCKCMVEDANDLLKELAEQNLDIVNEDYERVRNSYLKYAQLLIRKMNEEYKDNPGFMEVISRLRT